MGQYSEPAQGEGEREGNEPKSMQACLKFPACVPGLRDVMIITELFVAMIIPELFIFELLVL